MKEFKNEITLYLVEDIERITQNGIDLKENRVGRVLKTDDFTITPAEESSDAGMLYTISESIPIEKVGKQTASIYQITRSTIVQLSTCDGSPLYIGTRSFPAKVSITAQLNKSVLKIESKNTSNPLQ